MTWKLHEIIFFGTSKYKFPEHSLPTWSSCPWLHWSCIGDQSCSWDPGASPDPTLQIQAADTESIAVACVLRIMHVNVPRLFFTTSESEILSVMSDSLQPMDCILNSPGQNTGVGSLFFFRGSSQPRDRTQVFSVAGGFFASWATREAQEYRSG